MCRNCAVHDAQHLAHGLGVSGKQVSEGKGEADDPLAKRDIGKHLIGQQGGGLGHPAGATAWIETPLLAGKRYEPLEVTLIATHPQEPVFEATAFEMRFKLSMDMSRQVFALGFKLLNEGRVVFLYKLVEQSLLWAMAFIGGVTKGMPINRDRPSFVW